MIQLIAMQYIFKIAEVIAVMAIGWSPEYPALASQGQEVPRLNDGGRREWQGIRGGGILNRRDFMKSKRLNLCQSSSSHRAVLLVNGRSIGN